MARVKGDKSTKTSSDSSTKADNKKQENLTEYEKFLKQFNIKKPEEVVALDRQTRVVSTGILAIDIMTGHVDPIEGTGGIKQGSAVEFLGENNCYKTGTIEHIIRAYQRQYPPVYDEKMGANIPSVLCIFSETPEWQRMIDFGIKVDSEHMIVHVKHESSELKDMTAEQILEFVCEVCKKFPNIKAVIIDSVSALSPKMALESKSGGEKAVGETIGVAAKAKAFNPYIEKWSKQKTDASLFMISQYRKQVKASFMEKDESVLRMNSAAGTSKDFFANLRFFCESNPFRPKEQEVTQVVPGAEIGIKEKVVQAFVVSWRNFKNKHGNSSNFRKLKSIMNFGWHTDPYDGVLRKGYINQTVELLIYYELLKGYITEDAKPSGHKLNHDILKRIEKGGGSNWKIDGENYRSKSQAAEALDKLPDLRLEIVRSVIKYGENIWVKGTHVPGVNSVDIASDANSPSYRGDLKVSDVIGDDDEEDEPEAGSED